MQCVPTHVTVPKGQLIDFLPPCVDQGVNHSQYVLQRKYRTPAGLQTGRALRRMPLEMQEWLVLTNSFDANVY